LKIGYELGMINSQSFFEAKELAKQIDRMIFAITKKL